MNTSVRTLILYSSYLGTSRASYYNDWLEAFLHSRLFDVTARNIVPAWLKVANPAKYANPEGVKLNRRSSWYQLFYQAYTLWYQPWLKMVARHGLLWDFSEIRDYDLVVLLHSTNADSMLPLSVMAPYFKERRGRLLVFVGNEYCLMPEKLSFIAGVDAEYVATQLPIESARWLYGECEKSTVLAIPHALNSRLYQPFRDPDRRTTDIGFIGDRYPFSIGDLERTAIIEYFSQTDPGGRFIQDVKLGHKLRIPRERYIMFLNSIRATVGAESGTYYLEKTDRVQKEVEAFLSRHPKAAFNEVFDRFFRDLTVPVNGKAISSRHFEPIGTKTCQILLEGRYNDILAPDRHYLSVKKDLSNIEDVLERFSDRDLVQAMVNRSFEFVMDSHTYDHRVKQVWDAVTST